MRAAVAGLALYTLLILLLQALPGAGIPVNALKAVIPGFAVGWLLRSGGLGYGAMVGSIGGAMEVALVLLADLPLGVPDPLVLASVYTVAGSALTNALGGAAGEALASRGEPRTRR